MKTETQYSVDLRPATAQYPKHVVIVKEFKFDTIRQDWYWVTRQVREYHLRSDAETFAARFGYTPDARP